MWMQTPNNRTRCDNVLAELAQVRNVVLFPLSPQKPYDENHCIVILSLKLVEALGPPRCLCVVLPTSRRIFDETQSSL